MDTLNAEMRHRLGGVISYREGQNFLSAPNRLLAEIVSGEAFKTPTERYVALRSIVESVQPDTLEEVGLLHSLLTDDFRFKEVSRNFSDDQKVELYRIAIEHIQTRPLYLHSAMAQMDAGDLDAARVSLNKARNTRERTFHEPDYHVSDAEGRLELKLAEEATEKRKNFTEALDHLSSAERHFSDAIELGTGPSSTPHSYQGLGKTYVMMSQLVTEGAERWRLLLYAMQGLVYAENAIGEWANRDITRLRQDVFKLLSDERLDATKVDQITDAIGRANGYAFMASREIDKGSPGEAMKLVETGLGVDRSNLWLIRLHVKLVKSMNPNDVEARRKAVADYEGVSARKFDVTLAFELAMQKYLDGNPRAGDALFAELGNRARDYPRFSTPVEENRWKEGGQPKIFKGILTEVPLGPRDWGRIDCPNFPRPIPARRNELQWIDPQPGQRVNFEIIFNMAGPQASKVRSITR
jgi:hypothetical protein